MWLPSPNVRLLSSIIQIHFANLITGPPKGHHTVCWGGLEHMYWIHELYMHWKLLWCLINWMSFKIGISITVLLWCLFNWMSFRIKISITVLLWCLFNWMSFEIRISITVLSEHTELVQLYLWCVSYFALYFHFTIFMPPPLLRRRRHYVFGLSIRPSVRPKPEIPLLTCTWVRWSTRPTVTVLWHIRPSVRPSVWTSVHPSGEVSGHLPENAWREWPEILHADVSWPSSELISLWPRSVDFSYFGFASSSV